MTSPSTPVLDELDSVKLRAKQLKDLPYAVGREKQACVAAVEEAKADLRRFYASAESGDKPGGSQAKAKLMAALEKAQAALIGEAWDERAEGAAFAARRAAGMVEEFIVDHQDDLVEELVALAVARRGAVESAIDVLGEAVATFTALGPRWGEVLRAVGGDPNLNRLPDERLLYEGVQTLRRAVEQELALPVPPHLLPRSAPLIAGTEEFLAAASA